MTSIIFLDLNTNLKQISIEHAVGHERFASRVQRGSRVKMVGIVSGLEFQTLVHSTEDPARVRAALVNAILPLDPDAIRILSREMRGHYKNSLILLRGKIEDEYLLKRTLQHISTKLTVADKEVIASRFDLMSDKAGSLYLRFDKQMAYVGDIRLGRHDPVRVKIKFSPRYVRSRGVYSLCKEIGIVP
ncbi:MAG: hypothetical protein JSW01_00330 [Candidatus Bathyarchaeota archaeon]|nr:MAG: hypothetical protein JSW01_00330 [Candidatus Bathyarchaeota archaeon]